ncbi:MAG: efflux RND transporter periplasmic adaptor subunit [Aristaeellaceae bacterium]
MNKVRASAWMAVVTAASACMMISLPWMIHQAQPTERVAQVRMCQVQMGRVEQVTAVMGTVRYAQELAAVSPATGVVEAVYVSAGDRVKAGQALFRFSGRTQELAVSMAVSRQAEQAAMPVSALEGTLAEVRQAQAWEMDDALSEAQLALSAMTVRAAADGVVRQVLVTEHGGVAAGDIAVALSGDGQRIVCQAVLRDAEQLHAGMTARLLHDGELLCMAQVDSIGEARAENGQTVCDIELIPEKNMTLPLGAMVEAEIIRCAQEQVPVLPVEAIGVDDMVCWVADGRCYWAAVTPILSDEQYCWVDLPVGTQVVLSGEATIEGQRVQEADE